MFQSFGRWQLGGVAKGVRKARIDIEVNIDTKKMVSNLKETVKLYLLGLAQLFDVCKTFVSQRIHSGNLHICRSESYEVVAQERRSVWVCLV